MLRKWIQRLRGAHDSTPAQPSPASPPVEGLGQRQLPCPWGPYTLLEYMGASPLGETFVAKHDAHDGESAERRQVERIEQALLILRRGLVRASSSPLLARGLDEAGLYRQINHPSICRLVALETVDDIPLIVSEYAPGKSLSRLLGHSRIVKKPLPWPVVVYIAHEACAILEHLHQHRDQQGNPWHFVLSRGRGLAPSNFFIDFTGEVRLADAGLAHLRHTASMVPEDWSFFDHTPLYLSPEAIRAEALEQSADIFCLGWMTWELATSRWLFAGETKFETLTNARNAAVQPPREVNPDMPSDLEAIILHTLARAPSDRPPGAASVKHALARLTDLAEAKAQLQSIMQVAFERDLHRFRDDLLAWAKC